MSDEEIDELIGTLRAMLVGAGFGWVVEQAQAGLLPGAERIHVARSLIDAAEAVTVELADAEIRTLEVLDVGSVDFQPDVEGDGAIEAGRDGPDGYDPADHVSGDRRRGVLREVVNQRSAFAELRRGLDGDR